MPKEIAPSRYFPPVELSTDEGLLCFGGTLEPEVLYDAYRHGIFPWPVFDDEDHMAWWSPDPRAVIEFHRFHVSQRLARTLRSQKFVVSCNRDFAGVIEECGRVQDREGNTWLTPSMIRAYRRLHALGWAHSVEVWYGEQLAGGTYGVAIGGLFAAESMFYRIRDASKVALACLVAHLKLRGYQLLDIQQLTPHTASLGACEIPRSLYLERLASAIDLPVTFGERLESPQLLLQAIEPCRR